MSPRIIPILLLLAGEATAQGVTTAAIEGRVRGADGSPLPLVAVRVVNTSTGRRWETRTRRDGGYLFEDVGVGGPFRIDVRALGFAPDTRTASGLRLGQRYIANFILRPTPLELTSVEVRDSADPVLHPARTGPDEMITAERIAGHPNPGRDLVALLLLSPQTTISPSSGSAVTGGFSMAGQNRLYNSFRIDGGVNHDLYRGRLPGRETLPRPISLEALEAIQVLPSPFDVRHGSFAGGLVNAITKSGTNTVRGSVVGFASNGTLIGRGPDGDRADAFSARQYGGSIGGPIVRDRAHFFFSADLQHRVVPDPGPLVTDTTGGADTALVGVSFRNAVRFQDLLRNVYQLDPGTLGPVGGVAHTRDVFGKVTVHLGANSHLEASHHHVDGDRRGFIDRVRGTYFLSSFAQRNPASLEATRLIWTSLLGPGWSNELIISRLQLEDSCRPRAEYPLIRAGPIARGQLVAGAGGGCPPRPLNAVRQNAFEIIESLTAALGAHTFTLGLHAADLRFHDEFLQNSVGIWTFFDLDSLAAGRASRYERTLPGPSRDGALDFAARQVGLYAQDRWSPTPRASITFGLRADAAILPDAVPTNEALKSELGIDTGHLPGGRVLLSPRLGFNYQLDATALTFLRGGAGVFTGPPPHGWLGNAYRDNGTGELFLACTRAAVPRFDPGAQPSLCADGTRPVPRFSVFDRNTSFPQNLRLSLGIDREMAGGIVATAEVLYVLALHQFFVSDANLVGPIGVAGGEGNRPLYGTVSGTTTSVISAPARRSAVFGQVVRISDRGGDEALSLAVQARTRSAGRLGGSASYSYTRARDRMSLVNPLARQNLENTPVDGTLEGRRLRQSYFENPHRVLLTGTMRLPLRTSLSLVYAGSSGTPYTYVVEGDANADGIPPLFANDAAYVPSDSTDIALANPGEWSALDGFIAAESCLARQRGRIVARNSCRNPWFATVNGRLTTILPAPTTHSVELTADVYNVLNLLNPRWGRARLTIRDPWVRLLTLVGYDNAKERGVYRLALPALRRTLELESTWRLELGARYSFYD